MNTGKTPTQPVKNRWEWGIVIKTEEELGQVIGHNSQEHSVHSTCNPGCETSTGGITAAAAHKDADVAEKPGLCTPHTGERADILV